MSAVAVPVGGVAATEVPDGVVSPGGVGYDINCGVRLLALPLSVSELGDRREPLVHEISRAVPAGTGKRGGLLFRGAELDRLLQEGPRYLVGLGIGTEEDVDHTESEGPARRGRPRGGLRAGPPPRRG